MAPRMTRTITIPGTSLVTTALGFGCADLYRAPTSAQRRHLLDSAHAAGIRHFDVAPMYGLGLAERELGRFARGRRDDVVIAPKFGIAPTAAAAALARVQGPVRRLFQSCPALRRRAQSSAAGPSSGGPGAVLYRATGFGADAARASLEHSLRELGTDRIDLLLLHDPQPGDVRSDDVCGYLEKARSEGLVRSWGVAGEPGPTLDVAARLDCDVPVVQVRDDLLARRERRAPLPPGRIAFGVLGRALPLVVGHVGADPGRRRRWRDAVGADCAVAEEAASLMLRLAARDNPSGVVLFSTIRDDHLRAAAAAFAQPPDAGTAQLDAFEQLLATDPPAA